MEKFDYVEIYATALKNNNKLFEQQRMLINSQMQSSRSFFTKLFADRDFKVAARDYLKSVGKI